MYTGVQATPRDDRRRGGGRGGGGLASRVLALPRSLVSQNKRRYKQGGYDLDLCYLHPRIIVMGFPAAGLESLYRNSRREVQQFLAEQHGERFKVYNFCAESNRRYSPRAFADRVEFFPIEDHNVPTFHQILAFCEDAATWLTDDPRRVVVLHCKAGKGRAGMMACMLLLRMGYAATALAAIDCYNRERVLDRAGLTVTSQKKWVHYCEQLLRGHANAVDHLTATNHALTIDELVIRNAPTGARPPVLRLRIFTLDPVTTTKQLVFETSGIERFLVHMSVSGCVLLEFRCVQYSKCFRSKKHFRVWFHSMFARPDPATGAVVFDRSAMDWVTRDRKMRKFPAAFDLEMRVRPPPSSE